MSFENDLDTQNLNRWLNADAKFDKAQRTLEKYPGEERAMYAEQYARVTAAHARSELFRRTKMHAWNEGHEAVCPTLKILKDTGVPEESLWCAEHVNPYVAKTRVDN